MMKVKVVKDASGTVIASFETATGDGTSLQPVLPEGHTTEEMDVSDDYVESGALYAGA